MAREDAAAETLLDYVARERAPFSEVPFGPVDSAALTQVAMARSAGALPLARRRSGMPRLIDAAADRLHALRAPRVTIADFARALGAVAAEGEEGFGGEAGARSAAAAGAHGAAGADAAAITGFTAPLVMRELAIMAENPRFRDVRIVDYASAFDDGAAEGAAATQFAAMAFLAEGRVAAGRAGDSSAPGAATESAPFAYVAFRGTDATIAGWRENFDMAYATPVPAQRMAADYLASVARHLPRRLVVGGHSKGGNLALYAALSAAPAVRDRFARVYAHDAPGFKRGVFSANDYAPVAARIHRTVPTESFVGMLLDHEGPELVVRSTARGIDQHSVFTWEVDGADFAYADRLPDATAFSREVMSDWLAGFSDAETRAVVDAVFAAIEASGAESATEIFRGGPRIALLVAEAARRTDGASRDVLLSAGGKLAAAAARRFGHTVVDAIAKIADPRA